MNTKIVFRPKVNVNFHVLTLTALPASSIMSIHQRQGRFPVYVLHVEKRLSERQLF
jgi:hypothetical protein